MVVKPGVVSPVRWGDEVRLVMTVSVRYFL